MNGLRQIMYGVADFARLRAENVSFVGLQGLFRGGRVVVCDEV